MVDNSEDKPLSDDKPVLETVLGEISFFRSITRHRPVGLHRFFHVLSMQQVIKRETGVFVPVDSIWAKIEACYNLDALESLVRVIYLLLTSFCF